MGVVSDKVEDRPVARQAIMGSRDPGAVEGKLRRPESNRVPGGAGSQVHLRSERSLKDGGTGAGGLSFFLEARTVERRDSILFQEWSRRPFRSQRG